MVKSVVALLVTTIVLVAGNTDVIYVAVSVGVFAIGIAYAAGCEKL
jgi:hypothetical protein